MQGVSSRSVAAVPADEEWRPAVPGTAYRAGRIDFAGFHVPSKENESIGRLRESQCGYGESADQSGPPSIRTYPLPQGFRVQTMTSYHEIADECHGLARELDEVNRITESDFLEIVRRLEEISRQARQVASNSADSARLLDGDAFSAAIGGLRKVLQDVASLDQGTETTVETFREMLSRIEQASRLLGGFSRLSLTLKVLALNTRVESARVRHGEIDFSSLGDDVGRLADEITTNSESILAGAGTVKRQTGQTLARLGGLSTRQHSEFSDLVSCTTAGLDSLTRHHAESSKAAAAIAACYEGVCSSIGEVVRSLQFQDITRQQIEHVRDALRELGETLSDRAGDADAVGQAMESAILQAAQLRNSRDTLAEAGSGILDHLRRIAAQEEEISAAPAMLAGSSEQEGGSFVDAVRTQLAGVVKGLSACSGSEAEVRDAIAHVVPCIEAMSGAAGRIEAIGFHLGVVALNAQVKTAQIGADGAALGVLASHIQALTADTSGRTQEIAGHLRFLTSQTQELRKRVRSEPAAGRESGLAVSVSELDSLGADVSGRMAEIEELNRVISGNLAAISGAAVSLKEEIRAACESFTAHVRASEVFEGVIESLTNIADRLRRDLPEGYTLREVSDPERHQERYTMHSERRVHGAHYAAESAVAVCELPSGAEGEEAAAHEDFGENVELF
jgi:hypothetical protein